MKENKTEIVNEEQNDDYVIKKNKKLNILAIIFCLIVSLSIWLYVMNTENSQYEKTFTEIPVLIEGDNALEKMHNMSIISGYNSLVNVTVKGNKSVIDNLNPSDFRAYASVEELSVAGRHSVTVSVEPIKDVAFTNVSGITVYVDENITKELEIEIKPSYSIANTYSLDVSSISDKVEITGPRQVIETVMHATVEYDIGVVTKSLKFISDIKLYDENNKQIDNPYVTKSIGEIEVNVDVTTELSVILEPIFTANDTDIYTYSIKFTPKTLEIYGDPVYVEKVISIKINLGDISYKNSGEIELSGVSIPSNVFSKEGQNEIIEYTVERIPKTPDTQQ